VVRSWRAHQAGGGKRGAKAHVVVVFAALEREQVKFGAFEADEHRGGERTDDAVPGGLDFVGTHTAHVLVVGLEAGRA
jgi:hypothetical protein